MGVHLRKEKAGNSSLGHVWPEDGAVVEVSHNDAYTLLRIKDGGFTKVAPPEPKRPKGRHEKASEPEADAEK